MPDRCPGGFVKTAGCDGSLHLDDLAEASAVLDPSGRILACNQVWQSRFSRRNLLRQLAEDPLRTDFRELLSQLLEETLDGCTAEFAWSEGIWLRATGRRLHNSSVTFLVRMEDVSEAHRRNTHLARLQHLVEQLPDPVFFLDAQSGQTVYANPAVLEAMQISSQEEMQPSNYGPIFAREDLEKLVQRLSFCGALKLESAPRTAMGRRFPADLSVLLVKSDEKPLIAGVLRDSSERKRQLAALQTTGSRLQAILASSPVAIVTFTLEGLIALWNPAAERIYGWTAEEVLLKASPFPDTLSGDSIREMIEQGSTLTLQLVRQCKEPDRSVHLSLSICPLLNENGQLTGFLEVAEDITDRVNEDLLRSNRRMLESREAERLSLAREIHDGPMQELIAVGFALSEARHATGASQALPQVQAAVLQVVRHLRAVITRLRPAGLEEFGLAVSVEGMVDRLGRDMLAPPATRLHLEPIVELSASQELCLFRIVQEAYQNCLRHGQASKVSISLRGVNSSAELTVQDDGQGFSAPDRLGDLAAEEHYGLLGMQERAVLANGTFQLESKPGQGTRIRVTIPL